VLRPIIALVMLSFLSACGGGSDGDSSNNGGGGGGGGGGPTCTYAGSNYPVGQCIKINGSYMRCTAGGWQNAQMGGGGARPPGC
jgi:hypothetical protein